MVGFIQTFSQMQNNQYITYDGVGLKGNHYTTKKNEKTYNTKQLIEKTIKIVDESNEKFSVDHLEKLKTGINRYEQRVIQYVKNRWRCFYFLFLLFNGGSPLNKEFRKLESNIQQQLQKKVKEHEEWNRIEKIRRDTISAKAPEVTNPVGFTVELPTVMPAAASVPIVEARTPSVASVSPVPPVLPTPPAAPAADPLPAAASASLVPPILPTLSVATAVPVTNPVPPSTVTPDSAPAPATVETPSTVPVSTEDTEPLPQEELPFPLGHVLNEQERLRYVGARCKKIDDVPTGEVAFLKTIVQDQAVYRLVKLDIICDESRVAYRLDNRGTRFNHLNYMANIKSIHLRK